jgi:hypothetical protein
VKAVNATQTGDDAINFLCGVDINYFCWHISCLGSNLNTQVQNYMSRFEAS